MAYESCFGIHVDYGKSFALAIQPRHANAKDPVRLGGSGGAEAHPFDRKAEDAMKIYQKRWFVG